MNAKGLSIVLLVSLLLGVLSAGGCVSAQKYKDAVAANDRAQAELQEAGKQLQAARADAEQLRSELAALQGSVSGKDQQIARLETSNGELTLSLARLKEMYDKAIQDPGLLPLGDVVALPPELDKQLQAWAAQYPEVEYDRRRGMVKFKTDVVFAKGSDTVSVGGQASMAKFAQIVRGVQAAKFAVYIVGHTDDIPIRKDETLRRHPNNWYLSVHRAVSVRDVLAAAGVPDKQLGVAGFGEYHPIAPNAPGNKGNAKNRRVEIWIVPPNRALTTGIRE